MPKTKHPRPPSKLLLGLRELCERQRRQDPPPRMSASEIARHCDVTPRCIELLAQSGLQKIRRRLLSGEHRPAVLELLPHLSNQDPYVSCNAPR